MTGTRFKTFFISFFLLNAFNLDMTFASNFPITDDPLLKKKISLHIKFNAGVPGTKNPNGTLAKLFKLDNIPYTTSMNPEHWLYIGQGPDLSYTYYLLALPMIHLNPTMNIFTEYLQFALLPPLVKGGFLSQEETIFSKSLKTLEQLASQDPRAKHKCVEESHVGCFMYLPTEIQKEKGAVLLLPGSKGTRRSELKRGRAYAKRGVPCLIPDFVSTARTNHEINANSTIGNQLAVSFFGHALSIISLHYVLQNWDAVNPNKIVWDCESIGATQALLALAPEVISKFEQDFIPPTYLALNDLSPTLTTVDLTESLFWSIPKTIWGGEADEFTPLSQLEVFLSWGPSFKTHTVKKHNGYHDARSLTHDTYLQEGGTYRLDDAANYAGLCARMQPSIGDIRSEFETLSEEATSEEIAAVIYKMSLSLRLHLIEDNVDLDPTGVLKRVGQLKKGATFGPSSIESAKELRDEVIETVLKYAS